MIDLVCLVADKNMEAVIASLLTRHHSLGIRKVTSEILTHPRHDPGCFREAAPILQSYQNQARHALVVLDRAWEGIPDDATVDLERTVDDALAVLGTGWAKCILIDPELEVWLFRRSPRLDDALGWSGKAPSLHDQLASNGLWPIGEPKPHDPKTAIKWALSQVGKQTSSSIYREIAKHLGLAGCVDPSFKRLEATLRNWFRAT